MKGFRNSPYGERRIGAFTAIKARAPVLGGNFGVWGGLFSVYDCAVKGVRQKEDPYNAGRLLPYPRVDADVGEGWAARLQKEQEDAEAKREELRPGQNAKDGQR